MNKLLFLLLTVLCLNSYSQNVGVSTDVNFNPTNTLHVDGSTRIRGAVKLDSLTAATGTKYLTINGSGIVDTSNALGQSVVSAYGTSSLTVLTTTTTFTLIPGLTTTITVPSNCFVMIYTDGTFITNSTSGTGYSSLDFAIFIDGAYPTNGGYCRLTADNPGANLTTTVMGTQWTLGTVQALSAGSHTIQVRTIYVAGVSATVSSSNTAARQGSLHVVILKQ